MSRSYERLSIETFGAALLNTGDLDPIYIALHKMELDEDQLARWLVAYWCLYHAGTACYMSQLSDEEFWRVLWTAAHNVSPAPTGHSDRWPRGSERRHWRGKQAEVAAIGLKNRFERPADVLKMLSTYEGVFGDQIQASGALTPLPFKVVSDRAQTMRSFGPWISFKIADMLDRLGIVPVSFDNAAVFMFDDPRKAALRLYLLKAGLPAEAKIKDEEHAIALVVDYLTDHFKDFAAPPIYERPVALQEVETILCKWKSHMNGHYPLMNDVHEIYDGLYPWMSFCKTADLMGRCMPPRKP